MKKLLFLILFSIFYFLFSASIVQAAYFYFSPSESSFYKNENFTVSVLVNTQTAINAVQAVVSFPTEYLGAVDVNQNNGSIIDLTIREPSFSNAGQLGNVRFEGIILNPGFTGSNGKVIDIVFRVKKEGTADLSLAEFSILANNGLGTNVSEPNGKAHFNLLGARLISKEGGDFETVKKQLDTIEKKIGTGGIIEPTESLVRFWNILPGWARITISIFFGISVLILSLIILSLGLIILTWLWAYGLRKRIKIKKWLRLLPERIKKSYRKIFGAAESVQEEFSGDVRYSINQLEKDIKKARWHPSLKKMLSDYWLSVTRIIKRFFTKNI